MVSISSYTGTPDIVGLLVNNAIVTSEPDEVGCPHPAAIFTPNKGEIVFESPGKKSIRFNTNAPILVSFYRAWFAEDFQSGNRATQHFRLLTSMIDGAENLVYLDGTALRVPYYQYYNSDTITVSNAVNPPIMAQYFSIEIVGHDWGMLTEGPRITGFQIT